MEDFISWLLKKKILLWETAVISFFIIINLIICLYPYHYGIFRDELLYISLSDRLGWAYLEVPPIAPLILAGVRALLGTSYFSLHLVPALLSSGVIIVSALMVKKMGGSIYATLICLVCVTLAPYFIYSNFDYNAFDRIFWTLSLYMILLLLVSGDKKYWLYFGLFAGLGLMSKVTMLYLGFALFLSFLALKDRKFLFDRRFLLGGLIAASIFLPFILWQAYYNFPIIEYFKGYAAKLRFSSPLQYLNQYAFPVWISGIIFFLFNNEGKKYRVFGLSFFILWAIFSLQQAKSYLIYPYYTVLFAGGAVFITRLIEKIKIIWLKRAAAAITALVTLIISIRAVISIPNNRPVLSPEAFIKYSGGKKFDSDEKYGSGSLPQVFADCFGWEEMTEAVAGVYQKLSDSDKKKVCIMTANYGEAGALHYYGPKYGLPEPVCGHNIWYFWGPGNNTGDVMLFIAPDYADKILPDYFTEVEIEGKIGAKYAMPDEKNSEIFLCRGLHKPLREAWKSYPFKHFE